MKALEKIFLVTILVVSCMGLSCSRQGPLDKQEKIWDKHKLVTEFLILYKKGLYSEATEKAKDALQISKEIFELDHPNVAISLSNLATIYYAQGKYTEAVILSPKLQGLLRNVPPKLYLVMAGTEQEEKNQRRVLMEKLNKTELEVVEYLADQMMAKVIEEGHDD